MLIVCDELFSGEFLTCCSEEALMSKYWVQVSNKRNPNGPVLNSSKKSYGGFFGGLRKIF